MTMYVGNEKKKKQTLDRRPTYSKFENIANDTNSSMMSAKPEDMAIPIKGS